MILVFIISAIIIMLLLIFLYSACKVSSRCSRIEEKLLESEDNK